MQNVPTEPIFYQRYNLWQSLRSFLYGRLPLVGETFIALLFLGIVLGIDTGYLLAHGYTDLFQAIIGALTLLTFQNQAIQKPDEAGTLLLVFNILFSLLFIQSVLNSSRALFKSRENHVIQRALASVLRHHIILIGLGDVGYEVLNRLVAEGKQVVVIEMKANGQRVSQAMRMHVPVIIGSARLQGTLQHAYIHWAKSVIISIDDDLANVEIALTIRSLVPQCRVIMRAFNEEFDRGLENIFGQYTAFSTSAIASPTFAAAAVSHNIEHVVPFADALLGVTQMVVPTTSVAEHITQLEQKFDIRVIATETRATREELTLMGQFAALKDFTASMEEHGTLQQFGIKPPMRMTDECDTVVICGLGKIGYRVVNLLYAMNPRPHIVIITTDTSKHPFVNRMKKLPGVEFIIGDARDSEVLQLVNLHRCLSLVTLTADELTNLRIALEARRLQPDVHIVLRVYSKALADNLGALFGIHTTYSTAALASSTLASAAMLNNVHHAFSVDHTLYAMTEIEADAHRHLIGMTMRDLQKQEWITVINLWRQQSTVLLPSLETPILNGDILTVVAPVHTLEKWRSTPDRHIHDVQSSSVTTPRSIAR